MRSNLFLCEALIYHGQEKVFFVGWRACGEKLWMHKIISKYVFFLENRQKEAMKKRETSRSPQTIKFF
jgi:hypothetical protein